MDYADWLVWWHWLESNQWYRKTTLAANREIPFYSEEHFLPWVTPSQWGPNILGRKKKQLLKSRKISLGKRNKNDATTLIMKQPNPEKLQKMCPSPLSVCQFPTMLLLASGLILLMFDLTDQWLRAYRTRPVLSSFLPVSQHFTGSSILIVIIIACSNIAVEM